MADVNEDTIKALTGFEHENKVPLPASGVTMVQEVPGSKEMIIANEYMKKNNDNDLTICVYILRHHTIFPNFKNMNDIDLEDLVGDMHYKDVATIILSFFGLDLNKAEDREKIEQVFQEMGQEETSSMSPESSTSP